MSSDSAAVLARTRLPPVPEEELGRWLLSQRWFAAKAQELSCVNVLDAVELSEPPEQLVLLIVEVRTPAGTHELYQLPVAAADAGDERAGAIFSADGVTLYDALADERHALALGRLIAAEAVVHEGESTVAFHAAARIQLGEDGGAQLGGAEQSNSSVVLGERHILKLIRRLEAGISPELEMLSFLGEHGFASIAPLEGWYSYDGELLDATLGVMQRFLADARDGWTLVLDALEHGAAESVIAPLGELGAVTGRMHATLGADPEDPEFAPEPISDEHVALLTATIDEQIERLFLALPERDELAPIAARGEELRDRLMLLSHTGVGGRLIRVHGDYHLGQALRSPAGWTVIDFEGEPARPMRERRRKRSPLRDVAGMLRSFSYAMLAAQVLHGAAEPPADWELRARESFLDGYLAEVDSGLLPAGAQLDKQLAMFELEKVLYELRYELENRPDWLAVPVRGILRLLEESPE